MTCTHQTRQDIVLKEIHVTVRERRWGVVRGGGCGCGEGRLGVVRGGGCGEGRLGVVRERREEVNREGDRSEAYLEEQVSAVLTS